MNKGAFFDPQCILLVPATYYCFESWLTTAATCHIRWSQQLMLYSYIRHCSRDSLWITDWCSVVLARLFLRMRHTLPYVVYTTPYCSGGAVKRLCSLLRGEIATRTGADQRSRVISASVTRVAVICSVLWHNGRVVGCTTCGQHWRTIRHSHTRRDRHGICLRQRHSSIVPESRRF